MPETSALGLAFGDGTTELSPQANLQLLTRLGSELTLLPDVNPADNGTGNAAQIGALVSQLQLFAGAGGTIVVPATYQGINAPGFSGWPVTGSVQIGGQSAGEFCCVKFIGTGGNACFQKQDSTDFFDIDNLGAGSTVGGTYFADLQFRYKNGTTAGAALMYEGGEQHRSERLYFHDCPSGIVFSNILRGVTRDGAIEFNQQTSGTGIAVTGPAQHGSACNQIWISGYDMLFTGGAGSNSCIGILATQYNHLMISDVDIQGMGSGSLVVSITATTQNDSLHLCVHDAQLSGTNTAAGAQFVTNNGSGLYNSRFVHSFVQAIHNSTWSNGVVQIGTAGQSALLDTFYVLGVAAMGQGGNPVPTVGNGFDVIAGTHIWFGFSTAQSNPQIGLNVSGGTHLHFHTMDLTPTYAGASGGGGGGGIPNQTNAAKFAGCSIVDTAFCDMSGYAGVALAVLFGSLPANPDLRFYYNRGYNDAFGIVANAVTVPNATTFNSQNVGATAYWGPARYIFSGGGTITAFTISNNPTLSSSPANNQWAVALNAPGSVTYLDVQPYEFLNVTYTGTLKVTVLAY